jgi:hypothetical protein
MEKIVFIASWAGILLGFLVGSAMGLRFYDPQWLGGYGSWPRRMLRLGHVSMVALPLLNFASVFSVAHFHLEGGGIKALLGLLLVGQVSMPLVCFLSAYKPGFRRLFPVPVVSLTAAAAGFLYLAL